MRPAWHLAPTLLAALALLLPERAPADDEQSSWSGIELVQYHPAPARPPYAAPPAPARPPARVAPAPPPGARPPGYPAPPPVARPYPPGHYYGPGYYPRATYYVSPWAYSPYNAAPWYWGWGGGYGYYPVYPEPPPPPGGQAAPPTRVNAEVAFTGGPTDQRAYTDPTARVGPGASAGVSLRIESHDLGIHAGWDGFFPDGHWSFGSGNSLDYFTAHATWSVLSGLSGRLRLEGGLSVLTWPTLPAYGDVTAVGPDFGASGQVSLVGPFGVQGYARFTPWPRPATDLYAGAALRFGPMGLTAGWRDLRADGGDTSPSLRFAGPQFGLSFLF